MLFNSPLFLFLYLPLLIIIYYLSPYRLRNIILLLASIIFYSWGEGRFIFIILLLIFINFILGIRIHNQRNKKSAQKLLWLSVLVNLGALFYYKYTGFFFSNIALLFNFSVKNLENIYLPLAISFFTFHAISYNFDIYRKKSKPEKDFFKLTLYLLLFPHLLAGPIIRYHTISEQLSKRKILLDDFSYGVMRFIFGLAKKVLIADNLALVVDSIFAMPPSHIGFTTAWLGIIFFSLQIFFDFSGYSDMAIGLGYMFGFKFPENFNYPYISTSIREFWQRWHITLSHWFRDYLYIPLGGNRVTIWRNCLSLLIVFLLCGLWHGASWKFIIWGLIHGTFLALERLKERYANIKIGWPLRYLYTLLILMIAWVFFRAESLSYAFSYLSIMFGLNNFNISTEFHPFRYYLRNDIILVLIFAFILSTPIFPKISNLLSKNQIFKPVYQGVNFVILAMLLFFSVLAVAAQTYNPFIYFRF